MKIIFATGNKNKMIEIRQILQDLGMEILSMKEAGIDIDITEDGKSFEENAMIKAAAIAELPEVKAMDAIVLADDSGLEIDYLNKEPGIYSARYAGINIKRNIILALVISGGLAGLAGYVQYAGVTHRIIEQMPNNAGYTGIVIAYLSRLNPLVVVIVSILFAGLQNSSATVQVLGVPAQIATMIQGAVMIFVIAGDFFQRYKIVRNQEVKA